MLSSVFSVKTSGVAGAVGVATHFLQGPKELLITAIAIAAITAVGALIRAIYSRLTAKKPEAEKKLSQETSTAQGSKPSEPVAAPLGSAAAEPLKKPGTVAQIQSGLTQPLLVASGANASGSNAAAGANLPKQPPTTNTSAAVGSIKAPSAVAQAANVSTAAASKSGPSSSGSKKPSQVVVQWEKAQSSNPPMVPTGNPALPSAPSLSQVAGSLPLLPPSLSNTSASAGNTKPPSAPVQSAAKASTATSSETTGQLSGKQKKLEKGDGNFFSSAGPAPAAALPPKPRKPPQINTSQGHNRNTSSGSVDLPMAHLQMAGPGHSRKPSSLSAPSSPTGIPTNHAGMLAPATQKAGKKPMPPKHLREPSSAPSYELAKGLVLEAISGNVNQASPNAFHIQFFINPEEAKKFNSDKREGHVLKLQWSANNKETCRQARRVFSDFCSDILEHLSSREIALIFPDCLSACLNQNLLRSIFNIPEKTITLVYTKPELAAQIRQKLKNLNLHR